MDSCCLPFLSPQLSGPPQSLSQENKTCMLIGLVSEARASVTLLEKLIRAFKAGEVLLDWIFALVFLDELIRAGYSESKKLSSRGPSHRDNLLITDHNCSPKATGI